MCAAIRFAAGARAVRAEEAHAISPRERDERIVRLDTGESWRILPGPPWDRESPSIFHRRHVDGDLRRTQGASRLADRWVQRTGVGETTPAGGVAINLNTGEHARQVPLVNSPNLQSVG